MIPRFKELKFTLVYEVHNHYAYLYLDPVIISNTGEKMEQVQLSVEERDIMRDIAYRIDEFIERMPENCFIDQEEDEDQ